MNSSLREIAKVWATDALDMANVPYQEKGVSVLIAGWEKNKDELVSLLSKSPDWDEATLSIIKKVSYFRSTERYQRDSTFDSLMSAVIEYTSSKGLTDANTMAVLLRAAVKGNLSYPIPHVWEELVPSEESLKILTEVIKMRGVQKGMKNSRLIQKLLKTWDKQIMEDSVISRKYNDWVDTITDHQEEYDFVLSLNPADYLLMSHGNSWSSCHIINPSISHGGNDYAGQYKGGCLSYLTDNCGLISYIVPKNSDRAKISLIPKISRQMFFFTPSGNDFLQSKMYPGGESGMHAFFKGIIEGILDEIASPDVKVPREYDNFMGFNLQTKGRLHYPDYNHIPMSESAFSTVSDRYRTVNLELGNKAYCLKCGSEELTSPGRLHCSRCGYDDCGPEENDNDNPYDDGDNPYDNDDDEDDLVECRDCGNHFNPEINEGYAYGDEWVCDSCYDDSYCSCSYCGEVLSEDDDAPSSPGGDIMCQSCFEDRCFICEHCDETYWNEDAITVYDRRYGGESLCPDCASNESITCTQCDEPWVADQVVPVGDDYMCPECLERHAIQCADCGKWINFEEDNTYEIDNKIYCDVCVTDNGSQCDRCKEFYSEDEVVEDEDSCFCKGCMEMKNK